MPPSLCRQFRARRGRSKARYVLGLSATVARKDGHHPIIFMQCGPVRYRVCERGLAARLLQHAAAIDSLRCVEVISLHIRGLGGRLAVADKGRLGGLAKEIASSLGVAGDQIGIVSAGRSSPARFARCTLPHSSMTVGMRSFTPRATMRPFERDEIGADSLSAEDALDALAPDFSANRHVPQLTQRLSAFPGADVAH